LSTISGKLNENLKKMETGKLTFRSIEITANQKSMSATDIERFCKFFKNAYFFLTPKLVLYNSETV
jgi:hypothetical protein